MSNPLTTRPKVRSRPHHHMDFMEIEVILCAARHITSSFFEVISTTLRVLVDRAHQRFFSSPGDLPGTHVRSPNFSGVSRSGEYPGVACLLHACPEPY